MIRPELKKVRTPIEEMFLQQMTHEDQHLLFDEPDDDALIPSNIIGNVGLFGDASSAEDLSSAEDDLLLFDNDNMEEY